MTRGSIFGTRDAGLPGINTSEIDLRTNFRSMRALEKGLYLCEFNSRLTSVTVTRVDDLLYAYDSCQTTKALLAAIVKEFNMSRKQDDFVFWADVFVLHPKLCSSVKNLRLHLLFRWNCVDLSDLPKPC